MCVVYKDETIVMPETKEELVMNIMNFGEMESEEFPMSPEIIAREQQKDSQLKVLIKRSDKLSERTIGRYTLITYKNKIYIPQSLRKRIVINYSHSRTPPCAPARTHVQIQAPREPPN
jgi:hypothetical protein